MGLPTSDTVNFASSYKVRRSLNALAEGIQHVRLDIGSGATESLVSGTVPVSGTVAVSGAVAGAVYALRYDEGATYTYIGEAAAGSAEGSAAWRIKRLTNADNTIIWADGDTNFDNIWTNRGALSYS